MTMLDSRLKRISERITHFSEQPSAMTRDLLLEELRKCYDAVLEMPIAATEQAVVETEAAPAPPVEPVLEPSAPPVPEEVEVAEQPVAEVVEKPAQELPKVREEPQEKAAPVTEHPAHADGVGEDADAHILAGKLNRKPISDLRSGIPLNEKFGIIRNLFGGNASDFGDAVLKLNNSKSVEEMKHYFQLLTQRKDWDMESESYQVFLSYIDRRATTLAPSDADSDQ